MPSLIARRLTLLAASVGLAATIAAHSQPVAPRVTIDAGTLRGSIDSATNVLVFRGIPYAAPPVGERRWKAPIPPAPWPGVRDAEHRGQNCMQHRPYGDIDAYAAGVSEDCLYLNVWTPSLGGAPKPVMVWIHGGGFFAGYGDEPRHDGTRLAKKGAVVVTLNYRLGAFGYLAHPALAEKEGAGAGNYGLLDQVAALEWVKRNIARFGGDPRRVTVFGESAGGMSVGALIATPRAAGLFQRALLMSGTGLNVGVATRADAETVSRGVAATLGIDGDGHAAAAKLRSAPAESILAASLRVAGNPGRPIHWPVIDGAILPRRLDSIITGRGGNLVPTVVGTTRDEGDEWQGAPARAFARLVSARGHPVWLYVFARSGEDSAARTRGASHADDIPFAFGMAPLNPSHGKAAYDSSLAETISDYWIAFARTGNPNVAKRPAWPKYGRAAEATMEFGPEVAVRRHYRQAAYDSLDAVAKAQGAIRP